MTGWSPPEDGRDARPATDGQPAYGGPPQTGYPPTQHSEYHPGYPPTGAYPPADSQPQYPGYPAQGYPAQGYPAQNYPQYGYPAGQYGSYPGGYPAGYPSAVPDPRPGTSTAAAVLAYINAGLLILAGSLLLLGASVISDIENATDSGTAYGAEFALDGILNFVAGGLLIAGGVMLTGRKPAGRVILSVGTGIVLAEALYWVLRFAHDAGNGLIVYSVLFAALAITSIALAWTTGVTGWLRRLPQ